MGITMIMFWVFVVLFLLDLAAFHYGRTRGNWIVFAVISILIVLGITTLVILWFNLPM